MGVELLSILGKVFNIFIIGSENTWALMDLMLMLISTFLTVMLLLDKNFDAAKCKNSEVSNRIHMLKRFSVVIALLVMLAFFFTEDMGDATVLTSGYTMYYVVAFMLQNIALFLVVPYLDQKEHFA
ncbi:MAG: hypothetical protein HUJ56_01615 [Erysipelotrichaceae bacterium]|nr:hypothetical protein [Erysipelotrichaceae bacterium]